MAKKLTRYEGAEAAFNASKEPTLARRLKVGVCGVKEQVTLDDERVATVDCGKPLYAVEYRRGVSVHVVGACTAKHDEERFGYAAEPLSETEIEEQGWLEASV